LLRTGRLADAPAKRLQDHIYSYTSTQFIDAVQYQVTQPLDGDAATVRGG
jgi:hypothetical protein